MEYVGVLIGIVLGIIGMYKIDYVLYEGLNYFGKYVFFTMFNLFVIWLFWLSFKKFDGKLKIIMPILLGAVIFIAGERLV